MSPGRALAPEDFAREASRELKRILGYWCMYAPDPRGGFHGRVDWRNRADPVAPKAVVLHARILWAFSMGHRLIGDPVYRAIADRAYRYLRDRFVDRDHGGVYWSLDAAGAPLETRKQLYGQAFALFGLSEYVRDTDDASALALATDLWRTMEARAFDPVHGGYIEAFAREWSDVDDYILSRGEARKSMNTHLHILEAYTALHRIWPDPMLTTQLRRLLEESVFGRMLDARDARLRMFFTEDWRSLTPAISFGHDIEASWLICDAAERLGDEALRERTRTISLRMAEATLAGLDRDGSLIYECDPTTGARNAERAWWVLAEQMVGFLNAHALSGRPEWFERAVASWRYIDRRLIDRRDGEWFRAVDAKGRTDRRADKISAWKCPYHNARACAEVMERLSAPTY